MGQVFSQATGATVLASSGAFGKQIEQRKGDGGGRMPRNSSWDLPKGQHVDFCLRHLLAPTAARFSKGAKKKFLAICLGIPQYQTFPDSHLTPARCCRGRTAQLLSQPSSLGLLASRHALLLRGQFSPLPALLPRPVWLLPAGPPLAVLPRSASRRRRPTSVPVSAGPCLSSFSRSSHLLSRL